MIALNPSMSSHAATKPARRRWPLIIAALLVGHTAAMLTFVMIAARDSSFSIDPDYYGKAVRWDQDQARRRASEALGWTADLHVLDGVSGGARRVSLTLLDRDGRPLSDAAVNVKYFHHAHGRDVRSAALSPDAADITRFGASLSLPFAGEWQFDVVARSGDKEFLKTITLDVP